MDLLHWMHSYPHLADFSRILAAMRQKREFRVR